MTLTTKQSTLKCASIELQRQSRWQTKVTGFGAAWVCADRQYGGGGGEWRVDLAGLGALSLGQRRRMEMPPSPNMHTPIPDPDTDTQPERPDTSSRPGREHSICKEAQAARSEPLQINLSVKARSEA
ncbi:hypothetical protein SRHO_G00045150 [Serrasalmus rhombeus]